jgi:putative endopeptidase
LNDKEAPTIGGVTGDQRFFLGWASVWRQNISETSLRGRVAVDPHAPSEQRADIVRNMDAWYRAFNIMPGSALYLAPEDRVHIW